MNVNFNKLRKNLISKKTTIIKAIKILNDVKFKTLIIIDNNKKILGTLTDGDIRRGLLKGYNLDSEVGLVSKKNPITKIVGAKNKKKISYKDIDIIPNIHKSGKIKDFEIGDAADLTGIYEDSLEIVLMAGGFGKRLMPLTRNVPKPLLKIKNKSILELAMENFKKYGFKFFNISIFYKSTIIKKYFKKKIFKDYKISYLEEKKPL